MRAYQARGEGREHESIPGEGRGSRAYQAETEKAARKTASGMTKSPHMTIWQHSSCPCASSKPDVVSFVFIVTVVRPAGEAAEMKGQN